MASQTQWTWVWASSGSWCWTGKPGVLQYMGLQRVRHNWATELNCLIINRGQCLWLCSFNNQAFFFFFFIPKTPLLLVNEICSFQISTKDAPPPPPFTYERHSQLPGAVTPSGRPGLRKPLTRRSAKEWASSRTWQDPPPWGEWNPRLPRQHNHGLVKQLRTERLKPEQRPQAPNSADQAFF